MNVAPGIVEPPQGEHARPSRLRSAWLLLAAGGFSLLVSLLLVAGAIGVIVTDSLPDVDVAMTAVMVAVLAILALFAAGLGWLGIRAGRERLANPHHSPYPGG